MRRTRGRPWRRHRRRRSHRRWSRTGGRGHSARDGSRPFRRAAVARRVERSLVRRRVCHHHRAVPVVIGHEWASVVEVGSTLHAFERGVVRPPNSVESSRPVWSTRMPTSLANNGPASGARLSRSRTRYRRPRRRRSCGHFRWRGSAATAAWSSWRSAANSNTSAARASWAVNSVLLRSLASCPAPSGPRCRTGFAERLEDGPASLDGVGRVHRPSRAVPPQPPCGRRR